MTCCLRVTQFPEFQDFKEPRPSTRVRARNGVTQAAVHRRYRVDALLRDLFDYERTRQCLYRITEKLLAETLRQDELDDPYKEFTDIKHHELDEKLYFKDYSPSLKDSRKIAKPYWTDELTTLWKLARDSERDYLKFRGCTRKKREKKDIFINDRNLFNKCLRKTQREYNISVQTHIDSLNIKDPKAFWEELRKLGPKGNTKPDTYKVQLDDGSVGNNPNIVLEIWSGEFEVLYQANGDTGYDNDAFIEESVDCHNNGWNI